MVFAKESEEQDRLILSGIELISRKIIELLKIVAESESGEQMFLRFQARDWKISHGIWGKELSNLFGSLTDWELRHAGEKTFSKAFDQVHNFLSVDKA